MDSCRTVNGSSLFRHLAKLITLGIELSRGKTWPIKSLSVLSMIGNKVALLDQKWTRSESRYLVEIIASTVWCLSKRLVVRRFRKKKKELRDVNRA